MSRLRIAFVSFAFGEYSIRVANALAEHGEVALWLTTWQASPHTDLLDRRVDFRPFHKPRMRHPLRQLRVITRLYREIRDFQPDVIHLQQGYLWFNLGLARLRPVPLVVTIHDPTPHMGDRLGKKTPQRVADLAYLSATALIVHNEEMKAVVSARGVAGNRPIHVVPHPALGGSEPPPATSSNDGTRVLFFGRIWPYKGLEYLIRAEPLVTAAVPDAQFVIAGTGEDFRRYQIMMEHPEHFEVHNEYVPSERVIELIDGASVVVLPYVEATQSGVIPLAYGRGKPVIATTVGGLPSMVVDGETGVLVPPRDVAGLAHAIIRLLEDPPLRRRLGEQGRLLAETEWSPEAVAARTAAVYHDTLASAQAK